jgi:hypothetical protein
VTRLAPCRSGESDDNDDSNDNCYDFQEKESVLGEKLGHDYPVVKQRSLDGDADVIFL